MNKTNKIMWALSASCFIFAIGGYAERYQQNHKDKTDVIYSTELEVMRSERDYYKNLVEPENSFKFEAFLPDGMGILFNVWYQKDYPMSVKKRFIITCLVKDALLDKRILEK